ncbi:MAG: sugar ABC transporter permease [Deltaproteobacteria bacterium]|nr:sugar ABC transporter permease [Deltaproteobacteria bacterium]MBW1960670.1 sugar ABC transporter permease [Deltaproteobacteria bacterium]MBW1995007.1 sugar ABC transporter permease [Deltaproteobacteria bacterium]MBW2152059.1 sugar ABC transporter permease [Deltaproteobacteria bacterium]
MFKIVNRSINYLREGIVSYVREERARYGALFVLPSFVFFCIFIVWPVFYSFYLGFYDWNPLDPEPVYIGLANYRELFESQEFLRVILNTIIFIVGDLFLVLIGSITLALALNQGLRGTTVFRSIYYSPVVTSLVATAVIWLWILDPQYGIVNQILRSLNLPTPGWGADLFWAMPTVILTFSWREVGYFTVIYLAGLQGIPDELKEAARIDGCGPWRVFRHVTFPLLMPTTFFVLVLGTIRATQNAFAVIYVMTGGGPVGTTNVIVLYLYEQAFSFFRLGYASAVAYVLFVFVFGVTLLQFYFMKQRMEIYR